MAKQTSLFGKISGKLGAVVFATSGGETISREYNPNVSNPSTQAQVNQRARLKLMSQLSASLAPVIAIPKDGLVSSRNQFVKKNFSQSYASEGTAQVTYENLQLTNGNAGLPQIVATRSVGSGVTIQLAESADAAVTRVVYIMYTKNSEQVMQLVASVVVEAAGNSGTFPATLPYTQGDLVFYAYGMKDLNDRAKAAYGNIVVANAVDVARLMATRSVNASDMQFTQTRGATMYADEDEIEDVPEGSARVFVTALGNGTVNGAGVYVIGQNATVVAVPARGYTFVGWKNNGSNEIITNEMSYTFQVEGQTDLVAVFQALAPGTTYTVTVRRSAGSASEGTLIQINNRESATEDTIAVNAGESITVKALVGTATNVEFSQWWNVTNNNRLSSSETYSFIPDGDVEIASVWQQGTI